MSVWSAFSLLCRVAATVIVLALAVLVDRYNRARLQAGFDFNVPPQLLGKTALITGSTSGIGFEAALLFGQKGAHVIVHGPNEKRTAKSAEAVRESLGPGEHRVTPIHADLGDFNEVHRMVKDVKALGSKIHFLILNAAYMYGPAPAVSMAFREKLLAMPNEAFVTPQGNDRVLSVNHFGQFLLTQLLAEVAAPDLRIMVVTGNGAWQGDLRRLVTPGRVEWDTKYRSGAHLAYEDSKLANYCFARALRKKVGPQVKVIIHDPGQVATGMLQDRDGKQYQSRFYRFSRDSRWVWWHAPPSWAGINLLNAIFINRPQMPDVIYSYWVPTDFLIHYASDEMRNHYRRKVYPSVFLKNQIWTWGLHAGIGPGCGEAAQNRFWNHSLAIVSKLTPKQNESES